MGKFQVIVGNVGIVYDGNNYMQASCKFSSYVKASKAECGRAGGESVIMMHDDEIRREYVGTIDNEKQA